MEEKTNLQDLETKRAEEVKRIEAACEAQITDALRANGCELIPVVEYGPTIRTYVRVQYRGRP